MTAVATLIQDAMFAAKVLGADQTPQAGDVQLVLRRLQRMLDTWGNENLMVYATTTDTFAMTPGVATYSTTVLASGRPVSIAAIKVTLSSIDYPVNMINLLDWNNIPFKGAASIPNNCFYDATFPNGTMNFYPTPQAAYTCTVDSNHQAATGLTTATDLTLPPGYEGAIVDNLAVDIFPSFRSGPVPADLIRAATSSKGWLKRVNYVPLEMDIPVHKSDISNGFPYRTF